MLCALGASFSGVRAATAADWPSLLACAACLLGLSYGLLKHRQLVARRKTPSEDRAPSASWWIRRLGARPRRSERRPALGGLR